MRYKTTKYCIPILLSLLFAALLAGEPKPLNPKPLNSKLLNSKLLNEAPQVLLIGNSYFNYNDQPAMLRAMCDSAGRSVSVHSYIKSGTTLRDHTEDYRALAVIAARAWDYLVVVGGCRGVAYPQDFPTIQTRESILILDSLVHAANDSARLIYVMPWAFEDGMLWYNNWTDDYSAMQQKVYDNTLLWSSGQGYSVSPVGWAWQQVLDSLNYPLHYLHVYDWNHPTRRGSYLMTCVLYATIFQDSCIGNPYRYGTPLAEATWYQELASKMVLDSPELWNLPGTETATSEFSLRSLGEEDPSTINLTCFPNPFNPSTGIRAQLTAGSKTKINIYDIAGRLVKELYNGYLEAGHHEFHWNASDVSAGVYIVSVQRGREVQTQKIVYLP
jgi:Secretion system C-terminal sorting domain/Domain of unknown function (DUF4886)